MNDIGRNCMLGHRKKIAKFLMRTLLAALPSSMFGPKVGVLMGGGRRRKRRQRVRRRRGRSRLRDRKCMGDRSRSMRKGAR